MGLISPLLLGSNGGEESGVSHRQGSPEKQPGYTSLPSLKGLANSG